MNWSKIYGNWAQPDREPVPGYTILLLVPADLPVFLKVALDVCAAQDPRHCVETLVLPDKPAADLAARLQVWAQDYPTSPVRLVNLRPVDLLACRGPDAPGGINWVQLIRGVEATRSTHALWHDCDLFLTDRQFLRAHYEMCAGQDLACLGVSKPWDTWLEQHGVTHLVATWELMLNINWMRSFTPFEWRQREETLAGMPHYFDNTLWAQCQTRPERIRRYQRELGFVHFSYVTGAYREFQRCAGPYEDPYFRLLLIRLLVDAYNPADATCEVPPLNELARGVTGSSSRVTYSHPETRQHYPWFRGNMQQVMDSGLLSDGVVRVLRNGLRPFDRIFDVGEVRRLSAGVARESERRG